MVKPYDAQFKASVLAIRSKEKADFSFLWLNSLFSSKSLNLIHDFLFYNLFLKQGNLCY